MCERNSVTNMRALFAYILCMYGNCRKEEAHHSAAPSKREQCAEEAFLRLAASRELLLLHTARRRCQQV